MGLSSSVLECVYSFSQTQVRYTVHDGGGSKLYGVSVKYGGGLDGDDTKSSSNERKVEISRYVKRIPCCIGF